MTFPSHSLSGTAPALFLRRWGPVATLFVLLLLVAWPVAAQVVAPGVTPDELAVRDTDLAKSLLTAIFGDMTEAATRSSMLGSAMFKYTSGVMIVSAALFIFVAFFGTLKTAEHGELMGRWSNVAVPFRFVVGATAMFPMASGYSLAQLLLMWLVGNGIGLANLLWVAAVDGYVAQQVVQMQATDLKQNSAREAIANMVKANYCAVKVNEKAGKQLVSMAITPLPDGTGEVFSWGKHINSPENVAPDACGSVTLYRNSYITARSVLPSPTTAPVAGYFLEGFMRWGMELLNYFRDSGLSPQMVTAYNGFADSIYQIRHRALYAAAHSAQQTQQLTANPTIVAEANGTSAMQVAQAQSAMSLTDVLAAAYEAYSTTFRANASTLTTRGGNVASQLNTLIANDIRQDAEKSGWLKAGTFTMQLTTMFTPLRDLQVMSVTYKEPDVTRNTLGRGTADTTGVLYSEFDEETIERAIEQAMGNSAALRAAADPNNLPESAGWASGYLASILAYDPTKYAHPVLQLQNVGSVLLDAGTLMKLAETAISGGDSDSDVKSTGSEVQASSGESGFAKLLVQGAARFTAFLSALGWVFITVGTILAVLLPLVPALYWIGGIVGWVIAVLVGVLSLPLWTAAHLYPEGTDLAGKASPGYMLLLELTFRPALMVLGFLAAYIVAVPFLMLIMIIISSAMGGLPTDWSVSFLVKLVAFVVIYVIGCWVMLLKAFSLISVVPQAIFSYIGGSSNDYGSNEHFVGIYARGGLGQRALSTTSSLGRYLAPAGTAAAGAAAAAGAGGAPGGGAARAGRGQHTTRV